jgi:hypothetical protein
MTLELLSQSKAEFDIQHNLAADIIDKKYAHLSGSNVLSEKIQWDDLIDNTVCAMNESNAHHNLLSLLKFDIKGFINS